MCGLIGMRVSEALSARPSWFDFSGRVVLIRGKGDKERRVPVSDEAWDALFDAVSHAFIEGNDRSVIRFRDRNARALITSIARRAGLRRHVASHDLRATFATEVYNKTRDQRVVQELLGHAQGSTTEVYIEVTMDKMRQAVIL
jgi:site-specific recombinase XerD